MKGNFRLYDLPLNQKLRKRKPISKGTEVFPDNSIVP